MKRLIGVAISMLVIAGILSAQQADARTFTEAHFLTVQYGVPPVPVMTTCFVNGVNYEVDYGYRIWAVNTYGGWVIIGRIVIQPNGTTIAVRLDGVQFAAACQ